MSWRTVYNLYLKKGKKFAVDLDGAAAVEAGVVHGGVAEPME